MRTCLSGRLKTTAQNYSHLFWHFSLYYTKNWECCHYVLPCGKSHKARGYYLSQSKPKSEQCVPFTCSLNTHINKPTVRFQPLTLIANDCSLNVFRLSAFFTEKRMYTMYFTFLLKVMKAVIYVYAHPFLLFFFFLPEKQVLAHEFDSIYSSLCLWCMKRKVYSYRDWPLAGLLMGYGPQLHLFQWISLLGSAREYHVRACNREVSGLRDSSDHPWFHAYYSSSQLKIKHWHYIERQKAISWKMTKGFKDKNQAKEPWKPNLSWFIRGCGSVKYDFFFFFFDRNRVTVWKILLAIPYPTGISAY